MITVYWTSEDQLWQLLTNMQKAWKETRILLFIIVTNQYAGKFFYFSQKSTKYNFKDISYFFLTVVFILLVTGMKFKFLSCLIAWLFLKIILLYKRGA